MAQKKTSLIIGITFSIILVIAVIGVIGYVVVALQNQNKKEAPVVEQKVEEDDPVLSFNKQRYSTDDPNSLWVIVNKQKPLAADFVPQKLVDITGSSQQMQSEAADALQKLIKAAGGNGVSLRPISAYRSYESQDTVYNNYVDTDGEEKADTYSARPGHSEHQTGLAVDVGNGSGQCDLIICFATTAGGKWVAANAHTYGFVIRYTEDKTNVTGYQYEPWHLRYVGVDLANELRNKKQTMEEFFGQPAATTYSD